MYKDRRRQHQSRFLSENRIEKSSSYSFDSEKVNGQQTKQAYSYLCKKTSVKVREEDEKKLRKS